MNKRFPSALAVLAGLVVLFPAAALNAESPAGEDRFQIAQKLSKEDMEKARKLMKGYFKNQGGGSSGSSSGSSSRRGKNAAKVAAIIEKPTGFFPTPPAKNLDPKKMTTRDEMFVKVHMKLANKYFKRRDTDRAIHELEQIFERVPTLPGGRFMRAVIAARKKDYESAWRNIEIAQRGQPDDPNILKFIERLKGVFPRPKHLPQIEGVYRKRPECATKLAMDALERLFQEEFIAKANEIAFDGFTEQGDKVVGNLRVTGPRALPKGDFVSSLENMLGSEVKVKEEKDGGTALAIQVEIPKLPLKNPSAKPISGIPEFMKNISEETDVAVQESTESSPDSEGKVVGTYSIVARDLQFLNGFLRKIAPYATHYEIKKLYPDFLSSQVVLKGKVEIVFHTKASN